MKDYRITVTGGSSSFVISPDSDLRLLENGFDGFCGVNYDVQSERYASRDGAYLSSPVLCERELTLKFEISSSDAMRWRHIILTTLNSERKCTITYEEGGEKRTIACVPYSKAEFTSDSMYSYTTVTLRFLASEPYFTSGEEKQVPFTTVDALLSFPLTTFGYADSGFVSSVLTKSAENDGDTDCGIVVTLTAASGDVVNPYVALGDETVKLSLTLCKGDTAVISTVCGQKGVSVNGVRSYAYDLSSSFFSLPCGTSVVSTGADEGAEHMRVVMTYYELFLGI